MVIIAGIFVALSRFVEWIGRRKPRGPQLVAYRDVRVLGELIDN